MRKMLRRKNVCFLKALDPATKLLLFLQIAHCDSIEFYKKGQKITLPLCCTVRLAVGKVT